LRQPENQHRQKRKKKKGRISFEVDDNLDIKKPTIDKLTLSGDLNAIILSFERTKIKMIPLFDKSTAKIGGSI
jgi:hypothetical protein